jgi:hypothetical protein
MSARLPMGVATINNVPRSSASGPADRLTISSSPLVADFRITRRVS